MKPLKKKALTFLSLFIAGSLFLSVYAQDDKLQSSQQMQDESKTLNVKIVEYSKLLSEFNSLTKEPVKITPAQTKFFKGNDYIELESYLFIQEGLGSTKVVGSKVTKMRLYFNGGDSGGELSKIITEITMNDFKEKTVYYHKITDPSPATEDTDDIIINEKVDGYEETETTLGQYDLTISNPNRIKFKREFYLPLLVDFERLFRYTENYQRMYGSNNNYETIELLKHSQNY
ncbi:MAG: hypothetical protein ABUK01_11380 [Leptospirales bacterium]